MEEGVAGYPKGGDTICRIEAFRSLLQHMDLMGPCSPTLLCGDVMLGLRGFFPSGRAVPGLRSEPCLKGPHFPSADLSVPPDISGTGTSSKRPQHPVSISPSVFVDFWGLACTTVKAKGCCGWRSELS